ncbi:MAG: hypothetical protein ACXVC6_06590 [Bacteroidia bacterium]
MKRKNNPISFILLFIPAILLHYNLSAQLSKEDKLDSLKAGFMKDSAKIYKHANVGLILASDKRNTFIHTDTKTPVPLIGGQVGLAIDKHSIGIGGYYIKLSHNVKSEVETRKPQTVTLNMGYVTVFYEYQFINRRFWEIGIPIEVGGGNYQTLVTDSSGKRDPSFKDTLKRGILVLGTGINIDFKVLKWIGFNFMGGYRLVGGNEPNRVNFNGAFWSAGLHFFLGEFIREFRFHERRGAYYHNVSMVNNAYAPPN